MSMDPAFENFTNNPYNFSAVSISVKQEKVKSFVERLQERPAIKRLP